MMEFSEHQRRVDEWVQANGGYWPPLAMLGAVVEEIGELAKEINALEHIKRKKPGENSSSVAEELGDVLFALACIANHYNVDLGEAAGASLQKYDRRDTGRFGGED
jgi:NTP pyrophosphatase (non-canonical NTP hydrolase)